LANEPTRIVNTSETIIDLVFTNEKIEETIEHKLKNGSFSDVLYIGM